MCSGGVIGGFWGAEVPLFVEIFVCIRVTVWVEWTPMVVRGLICCFVCSCCSSWLQLLVSDGPGLTKLCYRELSVWVVCVCGLIALGLYHLWRRFVCGGFGLVFVALGVTFLWPGISLGACGVCCVLGLYLLSCPFLV